MESLALNFSAENESEDRKGEVRVCVTERQTEWETEKGEKYLTVYILPYLLDIQILPQNIPVSCDNGTFGMFSFQLHTTVDCQ